MRQAGSDNPCPLLTVLLTCAGALNLPAPMGTRLPCARPSLSSRPRLLPVPTRLLVPCPLPPAGPCLPLRSNTGASAQKSPLVPAVRREGRCVVSGLRWRSSSHREEPRQRESPARPPPVLAEGPGCGRGCQGEVGSGAASTRPPRGPRSSSAFQRQAGELLSGETGASE